MPDGDAPAPPEKKTAARIEAGTQGRGLPLRAVPLRAVAGQPNSGDFVSTGRTHQPSSTPTHNLPAPRSSFVGREQEMLSAERELAPTRLLTLTGAGGSGKTRLALDGPRALLEAYPDRVCLGPL